MQVPDVEAGCINGRVAAQTPRTVASLFVTSVPRGMSEGERKDPRHRKLFASWAPSRRLRLGGRRRQTIRLLASFGLDDLDDDGRAWRKCAADRTVVERAQSALED